MLLHSNQRRFMHSTVIIIGVLNVMCIGPQAPIHCEMPFFSSLLNRQKQISLLHLKNRSSFVYRYSVTYLPKYRILSYYIFYSIRIALNFQTLIKMSIDGTKLDRVGLDIR